MIGRRLWGGDQETAAASTEAEDDGEGKRFKQGRMSHGTCQVSIHPFHHPEKKTRTKVCLGASPLPPIRAPLASSSSTHTTHPKHKNSLFPKEDDICLFHSQTGPSEGPFLPEEASLRAFIQVCLHRRKVNRRPQEFPKSSRSYHSNK